MDILKFNDFVNEGVLAQELPEEEFETQSHPSELVRQYGKEMIDECIEVLRTFKEEHDTTYYELTENYVPKARLTLQQLENIVYVCDNVVSGAGYYFASGDDLNKINEKGLVPYDLAEYLKEIFDRI